MYLFYSLLFVILILATGLYLTRARWLPVLRASLQPSEHTYTALPSTFSGDAESGLSSSNFDLHANVAAGDNRAGLDDAAKREIQKIMNGSWFRAPVSFDEARRIYMERSLMAQGVGRDGRPKDPKFVSFS